MKPKTPNAPKNIRPEAQKLWKDIYQNYEIDTAGQEVLRVCVISLSRFLDAREKIDEEGATFKTDNGWIRRNPMVEVERISRQGFLSALNALGLEDDDNKFRPGRPTAYGV